MNCDKIKRAARFSKAASSYDAYADLQSELGSELFKMIKGHIAGKKILDIGCGTGSLSSLLLKEKPASIKLCDLSEGMLYQAQKRFAQETNISYQLADCEHDLLGNGYDLAVSNAAVQWFSSLTQGLLNIKKSLNKPHEICFSTFLQGTMREIAQLCDSGIDYLSKKELIDSVKQVFSQVKVNIITKQTHYKNAHAMLLALRSTGVSGTSNKVWTKKLLRDFEERYEAKYRDDHGVALSWECAVVYAHD